eukprot:TRINITY_DN2109_c1_g3_i1.p1 TRINITY_DN2109_c1_g3~~TRINITY_DN2109_c1_g3_i1.p1  ORF type:complete len:1723 (+),score=402.48 TRINITY_DN2109_c1_g3_i1:438-5606(+)
MHGRQSEESHRQRHMVPVPAHASNGDSAIVACFVKDGRRISVGDCALFEAGNAPPYIGIIRSLSEDKDRKVKLGVTWLYRPTDVKLGKGVPLEAAPNEVFYSFHRDEIFSDSLLHPCKVAFLRKGVELPAGVSSFVCRRVYDIKSKRLWWLTEQDYRNEQQEEVDKLLDKTRLEMHAAVQSTGTSKDLNGPSSNLKSNSESQQNTSPPSQAKGKKRERTDQNTDSVKRERFLRSDASDSGHVKQENSVRSDEIGKITNKDGSLINTESVAQLVHLMQLDRSDENKKGIDLALWRTELVNVLATTEREDCLSQFVQLRGLRILDDWLQEAHKGKSGDSGSPKESDKVMEDLLLMLLRALDRLPVDLDALKTYNVGISVNNLKNHKNQEIQKKARNLRDKWKKRVDAALKNNDTKSGSNQSVSQSCKQGTSESVQGHGGRRPAAMETIKSSTPLNSSAKTIATRSSQVDMLSRSASIPSGTGKISTLHSSTISSKDSHSKNAISSSTIDFPVTSIKEEKSSGSSQSQNNSQSWSSEPLKGSGSAWKEDARSSTAGSMTVKGSNSGSRHRKSTNGILVSSKTGNQKDGGAGKMIGGSKAACEKAVQNSHASDKMTDANSNYKLIVKLTNPGRISTPNSGTGEEMPVVTSRGSSPVISDKHDLSDTKLKPKMEAPRVNNIGEVHTESWQSNESRYGCTEGDEGDRLSVAVPSEERNRVVEESEKSEISKLPCFDAGKEKEHSKASTAPEAEKVGEKSGSITVISRKSSLQVSNAATLASGDEGGMKLLASVATTENFKNEKALGSESIERYGISREANIEESSVECSIDVHSSAANNFNDNTACISEAKELAKDSQQYSSNSKSQKIQRTGISSQKDVLDVPKIAQQPSTGDACPLRDALEGTGKSHCEVEKRNESQSFVDNSAEPSTDSSERLLQGGKEVPMEAAELSCNPLKDRVHAEVHNMEEVGYEDETLEKPHNPAGANKTAHEDALKPDFKDMGDHKKPEGPHAGWVPSLQDTQETDNPVAKESTEGIADGNSMASLNDKQNEKQNEKGDDIGDQAKDFKETNEVPQNHEPAEMVGRPEQIDIENVKRRGAESFIENKETGNEKGHDVDSETVHAHEVSHLIKASTSHSDIQSNSNSEYNASESQTPEAKLELVQSSKTPCPAVSTTLFPLPMEQEEKPTVSNPSSPQQLDELENKGTESVHGKLFERHENIIESKAVSQVVSSNDTSLKLDFDLNEGLAVDETNQDAAVTPPTVSRQPFPSCTAADTNSYNTSGLATPIAVNAKSKGPLLPLASQLRVSAEPGWKGTAATSAFRPAEPRRTPDKQHVATESSLSNVPNSVGCAPNASHSRPPLDIDLNVPDDGAVEDSSFNCNSQISARVMSSEFASVSGHNSVHSLKGASARNGSSSTGKLDLDLNRVEEYEDAEQASSYKEAVHPSSKTLPNGLSNGESQTPRGFDLNDGPSLEDSPAEHSSWTNSAKGKRSAYVPSVTGWAVNGELLNASSWPPPGTSNSGLSIHPLASDRVDRSYPVVAAGVAPPHLLSSSGPAYGADSYRGPVLTSNIASISYPNVTQPAFPYGGFSFSSSFPLPSTSFAGAPASFRDPMGTCYPASSSQLISAGTVSTTGVRPYIMGLTEMSSSEGNMKWSRPVLDLNAGPGTVEFEPRDSKQFMVSENWVSPEEQARVFGHVAASGVLPLKRKEPEGGWDSHSIGFSQSPWQ